MIGGMGKADKPATLTPRKRLLRNLRREPVDRISVAPFLYFNSVYEMFDYTPDMDIDCWGYLTPPPFGGVDFGKALATMHPDMALRGNVDQVKSLREATPQEAEDRVREVVLKAKARGNFILSPTDFFFDGTPYENIKAFAGAGLKHGAY